MWHCGRAEETTVREAARQGRAPTGATQVVKKRS